MDAKERLTLDDVAGHTLLAATHIHRYEVAADLCRGMRVLDLGCGVGYGTRILAQTASSVVGVDVDPPTIEEARRAAAGEAGVEFEVGDAHDLLRMPLAERFDCIVVFEVVEHLPDPAAALTALAEQASGGLKLLVSLPNSKAFEEENPHHVVSFGYSDWQNAFADLPDVALVFQFHAEGSLIMDGAAAELDAQLRLADRGEPEYANHVLALVNFGDAVHKASSARMLLDVAPQYNRYMLALERANAALREENARLAAAPVGRSDAAAASLLGQLATARRQVAELRAHVSEEAEQARREWIEELHRQIETQRAAIAELQSLRALRVTDAYLRAVARVKGLLRRA